MPGHANQAPEVELPLLLDAEQSVNLADFAGDFVYVDFWAAWCGPCRHSLPWLAEIHEQLQALGVTVVAINLDKEPREGVAFLERYPVPYVVLSDPVGTSAEDFGLQVMPSSYLLGPKGEILWRHRGFKLKDRPKIVKAIETLVAKHRV